MKYTDCIPWLRSKVRHFVMSAFSRSNHSSPRLEHSSDRIVCMKVRNHKSFGHHHLPKDNTEHSMHSAIIACDTFQSFVRFNRTSLLAKINWNKQAYRPYWTHLMSASLSSNDTSIYFGGIFRIDLSIE